MAFSLKGPLTWSGSIDEKGHREYKVKYLVHRGLTSDGPVQAMLTPGLPVPGSFYAVANDIDRWAFCTPECRATPHYKAEGEPGTCFIVEKTFSTINRKRCSEEKIENPLLEPPEISGDFKEHKEEISHDLYGNRVLSSSHEMLRGSQLEFPIALPTVEIKQNVATYYQAAVLPGSMVNCVNDRPLWNMPPRKILLDGTSWEKKYYGTCYPYYTRKLKFLIDPRYLGHDRLLLDEGTKVLNGHWNTTTGQWILDDIAGETPDRNNPQHFIQYKDRHGENCRVVLDGFGQPAGATTSHDENRYICIVDSVLGINPDGTSTLSDPDLWVIQTSGDQPYFEETFYERGNVVTYTPLEGEFEGVESTYIALALTDSAPSLDDGTWFRLPNGVNFRGTIALSVIYDIGDSVEEADVISTPGGIHVVNYAAANFLALGIPLFF